MSAGKTSISETSHGMKAPTLSGGEQGAHLRDGTPDGLL